VREVGQLARRGGKRDRDRRRRGGMCCRKLRRLAGGVDGLRELDAE
jgi:hypothetical protein